MFDLAPELRIEHPRGVKVSAGPEIQACDGANPVGRLDWHNRLTLESRKGSRRDVPAQRTIIRVDKGDGSDLFVGPVSEDDRFGEIAVQDLVAGKCLLKAGIFKRRLPKIRGEISACRHGLVRHAVDFTLVARAGDLHGTFEHVACAVGKPELQTALKQQRCKDRHEHGGHRSDRREQCDQSDVKPPAAEPSLLRPADRNLSRIKRH